MARRRTPAEWKAHLGEMNSIFSTQQACTIALERSLAAEFPSEALETPEQEDAAALFMARAESALKDAKKKISVRDETAAPAALTAVNDMLVSVNAFRVSRSEALSAIAATRKQALKSNIEALVTELAGKMPNPGGHS